MCGINGIVNFDPSKPADEQMAVRMRDSMAHRGPDGFGIFTDRNCSLGHRRLSILDLSENGKQPFVSEDGRYTITYNGEVFNYREFIPELRQKGIDLKSSSDTEVLLNLYILYGPAMLERLNGMWSFAIWDSQEQTLFACRDRIGVKPFYYSTHENSFYFASEPKALFAAGIPKKFDPDCLHEFLLFNYVAGENTVFKGVKRMLPGHYLQIKQGKLTFTKWWNLADKIRKNRESLPADPFKWFEETFHSAVAYRTISDVPVGVMLSGGLDSSSVASALNHNGEKNLSAFNVGFDEKEYDESALARLVAHRFSLNFHSIRLNGTQLYDSLLEATFFHDEPLIHQNDAQMLALAKYAKQFVTVLLSGEGGDEFMGGYVRYKPLNYPRLLKGAGWASFYLKGLYGGGIVNRLDKLSRYVKGNDMRQMVLLNASNIYPRDFQHFGFDIHTENMAYRNNVLDEAIDLYPTEPARQAMYCDLFIHMASILDRNDRMTMGAGIECRVPFLDYRLMEMIPALPSAVLLKGKKGKFLLVNSVAKSLPDEVLSFKKLGFSVPWERYLKEDPRFDEILGKIKAGSLNHLIGDQLSDKLFGKEETSKDIRELLKRQLLILEMWNSEYLQA